MSPDSRSISANSRLSTAPLGIAVIGCGRIAQSHLKAVAAQPSVGRIVAVTDADPARAEQTATQYGAEAVAELSQALARNDVDAVVLCTPNELHASQAIAALRAGKHVLVEKPMAESLVDAANMEAAADTAKRVLAIGQTFRHGAAVRYLQDHLADFGVLRAIEVSQCVFWDGPQAPWWAQRTPAQGLILSLFAPHSLDFVQMLMRDDPLRVHVEVARHQSGWLGEDEAMILLGYAARRMASVHISYNQRPVVDRKTLFFDHGVLRLEDGEALFWNDKELVAQPAIAEADLRRMGGRQLAGFFHTQFAEFVSAVRGLPNRSVLQNEGRRLIDLIERVKLAAQDCAASVN